MHVYRVTVRHHTVMQKFGSPAAAHPHWPTTLPTA